MGCHTECAEEEEETSEHVNVTYAHILLFVLKLLWCIIQLTVKVDRWGGSTVRNASSCTLTKADIFLLCWCSWNCHAGPWAQFTEFSFERKKENLIAELCVLQVDKHQFNCSRIKGAKELEERSVKAGSSPVRKGRKEWNVMKSLVRHNLLKQGEDDFSRCCCQS